MRAEQLFNIEDTITRTSVGVCHEVERYPVLVV